MTFAGRSSRAVPEWLSGAALLLSLALAWLNFFLTTRWAALPGALHGWRRPWYALALGVATLLALRAWRQVGRPVRLARVDAALVLAAGAALIVTALLSRLPPTTWLEIPFKDDWTPLFQQAADGVALLRRGVVVGWNWWFLGGYPTSTDIAQNFGTVAFLPMSLLGDRLGYHVLHVLMFLAVPAYVWWDVSREDRETGLVAAGLACVFAAGYLGPLGSSGDTNSLVGVCCAGLTMVGSRAAGLGRRWGGPVVLLGLTLALYTHTAFFVYAVIYLAVEAWYYRDRRALARLGIAAAFSLIAALPMHWESLRHPEFVSFNNTVYEPDAPTNWALFARTVYYNVEILALPGRWFNDYRSLANVWLPALLATALLPGRTRPGFYALLAVVTQVLLRFNTPEAGAGFDRIQHMFPMLTAPALAGFILRCGGTRQMAAALVVLIGLYVHTSFVPIRHEPSLRAFHPALIDRIAAQDGALVLVEISPHRDMDRHPVRRSQTTPFDVHWEGLLPAATGSRRFYSQSIDGWVFSTFRGQVVAAGTFRGQPIVETPVEQFVAEMHRWGVRHLFVWTDDVRGYLARSRRFAERWRDGRWSHFELPGADGRSVVAATGSGTLRGLDALGAEVELVGVRAGEPIVVRANYYPAWRAQLDGRDVPLFASDGQLAFRAPQDGSYTVRLEYPRYRLLSVVALLAFVGGVVTLGWCLSPLAVAGGAGTRTGGQNLE